MNFERRKTMVLAVIPARGGSKGIPRKNVRLMNGKPLIYYSIMNALNCPYIDDVVVSSDDEEILSIASLYGVKTLNRESALAQDAVTLDPVIYDAVLRTEAETGQEYSIVITLQATSPLLSTNTLSNALKSFLESDFDTYISGVNKPHLSWTICDGICVPNYKKRLNRQQLPPNLLETGAFLITRRECMNENGRIGTKVSIYETPEAEAVDIDSYTDWTVCEQELSRKHIIFRVDGHKELGMGHIYRCLTLSYNLTGHDVLFVTNSSYKDGLKKLLDSHMKVKTITDNNDFYKLIENIKPDVIVNDCLNTTAEYILELKKHCSRVITLEDIGDGADFADVAINALYEDLSKGSNYYWGEKYVCLKDEFIIASPVKFNNNVTNVSVMFGGSDPGNYTSRIYAMAKTISSVYPNIHFQFILGAGYTDSRTLTETDTITILKDVKRMSSALSKTDLAFTSQGRTVYELASLGIPAIVLAQNNRETKHTFAQMNNGFLNLGLGYNVSDETIEKTFRFLVDTPQIRREMRDLMLKHNLKKGIERVIQLILQDSDI